MDDSHLVLEALSALPRWHVVHWGTDGTSTLLCLWVAGRETLVPVDQGHVTYQGARRAVQDGDLIQFLRSVQQDQDAHVLQTPAPRTACDWLLQRWQEQTPDGTVGTWPFPRGGYIRWVHDGVLHVEASEGGAYEQPMPEPLRDVLVDLGWNPPNSSFRNCWLQPGDADRARAAELCVLTPMAAFGYDEPPALTA
jgi:hypothetical protein